MSIQRLLAAWLLVAPLALAGCGRGSDRRLGQLDEVEVDFTVSPDGLHYAYATTHEDKPCVIYDGERSDIYDEILRQSLTFSLDSNHFAFAASRDGQWYAVVDGEAGPPFSSISGPRPRFSPDATRFAYIAGEPGEQSAVVDDTAGPTYDLIHELQFSPDGRRLAYVAERAGTNTVAVDHVPGRAYRAVSGDFISFSPNSRHVAFAALKEAGWVVVVDGVESPEFEGIGKAYRWSADGETLYYPGTVDGKRSIAVMREGETAMLIPASIEHDGVVDASLTPAPRGESFAYVLERSEERLVVLDGEPQTPHKGIRATSLVFSGDGAHLAYIAETDGGEAVVMDGEDGEAYDRIMGLVFPPHSGQPAYIAARDDLAYVVEGDMEQEPCEGVLADGLVYSPDGSRMAYAAKVFGKFTMVVDGEPEGTYTTIREHSISWSEDGTRPAFIESEPTRERVILDREPGEWHDSIAPGGPTHMPDGSVQYLAMDGDDVYRVTQRPKG